MPLKIFKARKLHNFSTFFGINHSPRYLFCWQPAIFCEFVNRPNQSCPKVASLRMYIHLPCACERFLFWITRPTIGSWVHYPKEKYVGIEQCANLGRGETASSGLTYGVMSYLSDFLSWKCLFLLPLSAFALKVVRNPDSVASSSK